MPGVLPPTLDPSGFFGGSFASFWGGCSLLRAGHVGSASTPLRAAARVSARLSVKGPVMADTLLLEFSDPSISLQQAVGMYDRVNDLLGVDPSLDPAGSDEWPPGLLSHVASAADGALVVVETWESRSLQDEFMRTRLQPAFAQADVPPPARMLWLTTVNSWQRSPVSV